LEPIDPTEFRNCVLYLVGFQGVGKLTVAREICRRADFRLIDNHAINNLVFPFVREDGQSSLPSEIWGATRRLREIVLETMATIGNRDFNFVFTNALLDGEPNDLRVYEQFERAVAAREGCFIPVQLVCDEAEHVRRMTAPEREIVMKQTDGSAVARLHGTKRPFLPDHPHAFTVDVTRSEAGESARKILMRAEAIYSEWRHPQDV